MEELERRMESEKLDQLQEAELGTHTTTSEGSDKYNAIRKLAFDNREFNRRRMDELLVPSSGKMVLLDKLLPKLSSEHHKVCFEYNYFLKLLFYFNVMKVANDVRPETLKDNKLSVEKIRMKLFHKFINDKCEL